ncbi:class I SAM-dependent methyltransferase, partial [Termitidicoccus mucosus]
MNPPNAESSINFGLAFVPRLMRPDKSAWVGHLPFAASLVHALRPRQVVELGTHWGDSFFTFCQAALELKLDCQCHAVDTWHGDPQAGQYGEEVYQFVEDHGKKYYPEMSSLLRKSFDEAVQGYDDGSIDLLHIDGLHIYDAVRHDFDAWYSKVRPGGIILFHDIAVRNDDFGVWRLWEEITKRYDECFSFSHCFGLGVLRKSDGNDGGPFF